jgi:hypothetical protein
MVAGRTVAVHRVSREREEWADGPAARGRVILLPTSQPLAMIHIAD